MRPLLVALVLLLTTGCSSSEPAARTHERAQSAIVQPGRPGEANSTLDPDTTLSAAPATEADVMFVQMMVPHHAQALAMCELASTRARADEVVSLARRIKSAQGPEVLTMSAWLRSRGEAVPETVADVPGHEGHDMAMPGMLTAGQMRALARARGRSFDRLFLRGMIQHHQGAVDMADVELTSGAEQLAMELAAEVKAGQSAEIGRMRDLLAAL